MESEFDEVQLLHNTQLFYVIYSHDFPDETCEAVKECLDLGADINAVDRNNDGNTVLHEAVTRKSKHLISFLLNNGANTDIRNDEGLTAYELARHLKCDDHIIELFEKHSQEENSRDQVHFTSLMNDISLSHLSKCFWSTSYVKHKEKYIEIDCKGSDEHILHRDDFYRTVEMFENLILVSVLVSDETQLDDSVVLNHLKSIKNPIIIQCRSSSTVKVYFKEHQRSPDVIDLNSVPKEVDQDYFLERLKAKESFGLSLILEGLKQNVFGKFNSESQKSLFDLCFWEKRYNGLWLIDYAVQHGHLLAVRWLRLDLYKVRWKSSVYPVQTMSREMLAALLKVEFPIPMRRIQLSTDVVDYFRSYKDEFFKVAAYNQRQDLIEFLLQCTNEFDYKHLIKSLVKSKRYIVALAIIKADGLYPDSFDNFKVDVSIPGGREFVGFFSNRNELHDLIVNRTLEDVKKHLSNLYKSKLYLNTRNESAVATALRSKNYDIYRYLLSKSAEFKDRTERQLLSNSNFNNESRLHEQMIKLVESSIEYLLSKTRMPSSQLDDGHKQQMRSCYEQLNEIPEISVILSVVQYSDYLDIIFDFDHESPIELDPMSSTSEGIYYPVLGRIYIGAKLDEKRLLGVIAHELTHLAMRLVYCNQGKPYFNDDIVEELIFSKLVAETSQMTNVDPVIGIVFKDGNQTDVRVAELIVRVNHMLATYGLESGKTMLKGQIPHLFEYYHSKVMPQCQRFIYESHLIKMRQSVQEINNNSGIIKYIIESNVVFKSQCLVPDVAAEIEKFLDSDHQLFIFKTNNTRLNTIWIHQLLMTRFCSCENSFVVSEFAEFRNIYDLYKDTLISDACRVIVLDSTSNYSCSLDNVWFHNAVADSGKKFIVVTPASMDCQWTPDDKVKLSKLVHSVSLNDLTVVSIERLLYSDVKFQGKLLKLRDLIETSSYDVVDAETMIKLANKEIINIGKELPIVETFYVPRALRSEANVKTEWVKKYLENQKSLSDDIAVCIRKKSVEIINLDSTNQNHFRELCDKRSEIDMYWLKRKLDHYICKKSKSAPVDRKEFVEGVDFESTRLCDDSTNYLSVDSLLDLINSFRGIESTDDLSEISLVDELDEHRMIIIGDKPGMGKTTLLTRIARLLKDKHPTKWIVKVNLNMCTKVLDEEAKDLNFEANKVDKTSNFFVDKLLQSRNETKLETNFETAFIQHCIRSSGNIIILFDAFDELKVEQQTIIVGLIKCLQKTKVKQMWVTIRPDLKEQLENELL